MNYGLVRLNYFKEVNGFDDNYNFYCADGDLCMKFYEKGKQLIPLPGCFVIHNNVMDNQKKSNLNNSTQDIELYIEKWKHYVTTKMPEPRRLLWNESGPDKLKIKERINAVSVKDTRTLISDSNTVDQLREAGVWNDGQPLRLHLGCGERYLNGYVNIDYPPAKHTVQKKTVADLFADVITLSFPDNSVDEVRIHHVFEHFDRPTAIALLCRWHQWLKIGGIVHIETPDFEASMTLMSSSEYSYVQKQSVMRHLFGSHEADWAIHMDGWYREKYEHILSILGFDDILFEYSHWQMTYNITVKAKKQKIVDLAKLRQISKDILRECMIDESPTEEELWALWSKNCDRSLTHNYALFPIVSIIMPVYNSEKYLAETLDSILLQTYCDFEIIMADDGSTDKSLQIARDYEYKDKRIKVLSLPHNGEVKTRNEAIKHTNPESKYLLNHDSDDISLPDKLEKLVGYLEEHPEIAIVGCFAEYFDDEYVYRGKPPIEWQPERIRETFGQINSIINSTALIRRDIFDTLGGYREEYRSADDYDFFARALLAGFSLANIPESLHKIRLHPNSIGSKRSQLQEKLAQQIRQNYNNHFVNPNSNHLANKQSKKILEILHTSELYYPHVGGAEVVVQQISERLVKRGHLITVATTKLKDRTLKELNGVHIEEFSIAGSIGNGIRGDDIERFKEYLLNHPSDVMMNYAAQQWATDIAFNSIESTRHRRVNIIAPCGYSALADSQSLRWPQFAAYFNLVIPQMLPLYDAAIYHSSFYKDYEYAQNHRLTNSVIIPNGVDEEEFSTKTNIYFRKKYKIRTKYLGLCVANYYDGKGQDRVIQCVRQMNRPDFTLVFIGRDGGQLENLKAQAADLNIQFCVDIPREDTLAAYHEADIFLFGSYIEASPLVIIEAKASKTPYVSTDCGNVREWKGGIVCTPDEMSMNANRILDDENLRKQFAEAGWREWKDKLTWESVVDKYEELYLRLSYVKIKHGKIHVPPHAWKCQLSDIQQQIQTDYSDISLYLNAAEILLNNSEIVEAMKYIEDALELDPGNHELLEVYQHLSR